MIDKPKVSISINPSYKCNMTCNFCYLNHTDDILDLDVLETKLTEISNKYDIADLDLYGGELLILDDVYLMRLILICKKYVKNISVITNGTVDNKTWIFNRHDITFNFSYDYIFRDMSDKVFETIKQHPNSTIILTSQDLYDAKYEVVKKLNTLTNPYYIDVKICMPSEFNNVKSLRLYDYETFVKFLIANLNSNFTIIPKEKILHPIEMPKYHCFINPNGEIQNLSFNGDIESFTQPKDDILETNTKCAGCSSKCIAEHIFNNTTDEYDCLGLRKLSDDISKLSKYNVFNWRKRRILSYIKHNKTFDDQHLDFFELSLTNTETFKIIKKFFETKSQLLYPAKSYYVAIIYAWLLHRYFGENIRVALNYPDLLNYDDKYFVVYEKNKELYDKILNSEIMSNLESGKYNKSIESTVCYFNDEFLITQ